MLHFMAVASLEWVLNIKENVLPRLVPKEGELVKLKPKNPVIENVDNIDNKVTEKINWCIITIYFICWCYYVITIKIINN